MTYRKKLIEVALPLEAINRESLRRKQKAPKGWPTLFHKWWAQRPLAAARAVIFAQIVDDPSSNPAEFPTAEAQTAERERLLQLMEELILWDNTTNTDVERRARAEIAKALANTEGGPTVPFLDPFAGGASLPLAAQWLGIETFADDLNPVPVLINKGLLEIPYRFRRQGPVNPRAGSKLASGVSGLSEDVRYYADVLRDTVAGRIGERFPKITITPDVVDTDPHVAPYEGKTLTVTAWIWARTVRSPDPAFSSIEVPLSSTFVLCNKKGREAYIEVVPGDRGYEFRVRTGRPDHWRQVSAGTKTGRGSNFRCVVSGAPITADYVKREAKAGRLGTRLMAMCAVVKRGRIYLSPTLEHEEAPKRANPPWRPTSKIYGSSQYLGVQPYGMDRFDQIYTERQLDLKQALNSPVRTANLRAAA